RLSTPLPFSLLFLNSNHLVFCLADHHHKVNFWEDPFTPSKWKPEHFVIVSMTGSGLLIYGGYKYFVQGDTNNNNEKKKVGGEPAR
ncbi:hypothetical protein LINGRAPRIM_LOCUS2270, partial [Linum grandiflorum]